MTRKHAAVQLLKLGPLTRAEFIAITGWGKAGGKYLHLLADQGVVSYARRLYWVES